MTTPALVPPRDAIARDVRRALEEDIGSGDVTADLLPEGSHGRARVITREAATLCGRDWFEECFRQLDPAVRFEWFAADGDRVTAGALLCRIEGRARALVTAERSALNFLQTLSATANAVIQAPGATTLTAIANAVIQARQILSAAANAVIQARTTKTATANALIAA